MLAVWLCGGAVAMGVALLVQDPYLASLVSLVAIACLFAASMRFTMLIGELNFALSAFVAIGAYGAGVAVTRLDWPFAVAIAVGPVAAAGLSILFGLVTFRVKGPYFMLIGLAFAEAVRILLSRIDYFGAVSGLQGIYPPRVLDAWMPALVVAAVLATLLALHAIERSDFGKVLVAIRDHEAIPTAAGIDVLFFKVACFCIASFVAGVAGTLHAFVNNVISPNDFSFLLSAFALAYVKVGGERSMFGAVAGAVLLVLTGSFAIGLGAGEHFFYGGALVLAMLLMPQGLGGLWSRAQRWAAGRARRRDAKLGEPVAH